MKTLARRTRATRGGFSLAELMVVIVIIGLLATLVVPNVLDKLKSANKGVAVVDIRTIAGALDAYALENGGRYPDSLEALVTPDDTGRTYLNMEIVPLDPWGNEYQYEPPGPGSAKPRIYSFGEDGEIGGEGDAAEITYEMIRNKEV